MRLFFVQCVLRFWHEVGNSKCKSRLDVLQVSVITARPYIFVIARGMNHAHKTNLDAEKGDSETEIKVGWQKSSKKEGESCR
jgi:hypothetical protein